jgi:serine/threonine protein kinase
MSGQLSVQQPQLRTSLPLGEQVTTTPTKDVEGQDKGRRVKELRRKFQCELDEFPKTKGPPSNKSPQSVPKDRNVKLGWPPKTEGIVSSKGPKTEPKTTSQLSPKDYNYKEYVQKFGSKTANLYEIERLGGKVPERCPVSTKEIFDHLLAQDKENVIKGSWEAMKQNGKFDDANLKKITDKIEEIFNKPGGFPFTKEQRDWINLTMAGKVIIARSTGDEDSADTPNAGGNESVLFVEPTTASVSKAMKEVVLSYFGADSIRNRTQGDGVGTVLAGLPKMPVLLMEMISEPIKESGKVDKGEPPPIGIAMSTDKAEFTGGEDFHFVSISSAVGPGVNEGSGRVQVDESFVMQSKDGTPLLIYQQPSVKQERIRAVKDEQSGKVTSEMEKNSKQLAYSPSLSRDQVRDLVTTTDKIKMLNQGKTTEVEGVVGGDKQINFVQHRAIPDPRSEVDPTYVSRDKAEGHSKVFNYSTVVPKSGDALVITDWSQVCFAETMKEAEGLFDWEGGSHKIVIVRQPDCSNSHPAVNFGSHKKEKEGENGKKVKVPDPIPCLVVPNYGELLALSKKTTLAGNQPLVIDGQTQKAFVWSDKSFDPTAITKGRISHHIGLETSVTDKGIEDLVGKLKTTKSDQIGTLKKDLDPILKSYGDKIQKFETLLTKNSDTIHNSEGLMCQLKTTKENFEAVKAAFAEILAGNPKYTFDESTHARLLLVKFLEASMHDVDTFQNRIDAENSASRYLQALKGSPVKNPVLGDQVHSVQDGLTGPLMMRWKRFLTLAEQSGLSKQEISDFKGMMENLDKMGVTANWMSTVFDKKYDELLPSRDITGKTSAVPHAKELLKALVKDYKDTEKFLAKQQSLQKKLGEVERGVADFATPSKFEKAFGNLKSIAQTFIDEDWPKDLNDSPLKKAVQIQTLGRLIEVYDNSIKTLKGSALPVDQMLKAELEMMDTFKALHESLFTKIKLPGPGQTQKAKTGFIDGLNLAYDTIKKKVESETDHVALGAQSRCGKDFNVNTCLSASGAKDKPSNVEEMFTTLHQSLEAIRSGLMVGGSDYGIDMPKEMQNLLSAIPKLAMQTQFKQSPVLVGREISSTGVTYTYNMPVLDHGIKIRATYEKPTPQNPQGKTYIELDFYAANLGGRLQNMAKLAKQFRFGSEGLDDPSRRDVVWGKLQMKSKFEMRSDLDIQRVTTLINEICGFSLARNWSLDTNRNIGALGPTVEKANDPTSGRFPVKRERILNDFLNVAFGTVVGTPPKEDGQKITYNNKDYNIQLIPSGPPLTFNDGAKVHALNLKEPMLGLDQPTYDKHKDQLRTLVENEVMQGSHKFSFDYKGKTYTVDLNSSDLGLSTKDLKALSLNPKNLASLKDQLSLAWDNAVFYVVDEFSRGATQFESNWTDFMYGSPLGCSKQSKLPELDLWKSISAAGKKRGDLEKVDKAFEKVLQRKYALQEIETRIAEKGTYTSPTDKLALGKALQEYHRELSKCEVICAGYIGKAWDDKIDIGPANVQGKVKGLGEQTMVQRKALENRMLILGMEPERLTEKEIGALPFNAYNGKYASAFPGKDFLPKTSEPESPPPTSTPSKTAPKVVPKSQDATPSSGPKKPTSKVVPERGKSSLVPENRVKIGGKITELNKEILGAISSLKSDAEKNDYSMAVGLLESSRHLIRESDLAKIESTWKTKPQDAIKLILQMDLISGVSDVDKLSKPEGTRVGLTNGGADCFINSSLQLLCSLGVRAPLDMPQLGRFFGGNIHTGGDCRNLRTELRNKAFQDVGEIHGAIVDGTAVSQQDAATAVGLLLDKIGAPKLEFSKTFTRTQDNVSRPGPDKSTSVLPLQLPQNPGQHSLSGLVTSNLTSQLDVGGWNDRGGDHRATETLTLKDPAPDTAVVSIGRFSYGVGGATKRRDTVTGITDPVTMTDSSGKRVSYEPRSIICHLGAGVGGGHYVTYRKEGPDWLLFNDNNEVGVRVNLNDPLHKDRIEHDSYVVAMTKVGVPQNQGIPNTPPSIPPSIPPDSQVQVTSSVSKGSEPITGSSKQVQSEPKTVTPWVATKKLGIPKENLEKPGVLSSPTRPQAGTHELHSKAFKAIFDKGTKFPDPTGVKNGEKITDKVSIDGKQYDVTATAKTAKGSGAVIWMVSLSETGGSSAPTEFVIKANPMKLPDDSSVEMRDFAALDRQKNLREVQVLDHMSGNEHALQFHGAYSMPDGTLVYGMEKAQGDMLQVLDSQVKARNGSKLVASTVDNHLLEMSQALRDIHATGQVHGDVKPDNFMLGSDGRARIADFGECYMDNSTKEKNTLKDDLQRYATMAFNLRYGLQAKTDDLHTAIGQQQKDLKQNFDAKILELESDLAKQISQWESVNPKEPLIAQLKQQLLDLNDPDKRLDTILQLSGGKLDDESVRSYLINDLLLKTLQTPAPSFDTMNHVTTQLAKLVAQ